MMRPFGVLLALIAYAACVDGAIAWNVHGTGAAVSIPTMVAGSLAPASQTPFMPSTSTWGPSCADSTWGIGCQTSGPHVNQCIAPTTGTPVETCMPPQELVVTGGSGNGTSATIDYTSYANYSLPIGYPLVVNNATNTAWDTPLGYISWYTSEASNAGCPSSGPSLSFYMNSPYAMGILIGQPIYVAGLNGWNFFSSYVAGSGGTNGTYTVALTGGHGSGAMAKITVSGGSVTALSAAADGQQYIVGDVLTVSPSDPNYSNIPSTFSATVGQGPNGDSWTVLSASYTASPGTFTGSSSGTTLTISSISGSPIILGMGLAVNGINGLAISGGSPAFGGNSTSGKTGAGGTGTYTINQTQSISSGTVFTMSGYETVTVCTGSPQVTGFPTLGFNYGIWGYGGTFLQPWIVSASFCSATSCSVTFNNPTACSSSCVSASTQIVAGQFDDPIMQWHYGENVPYSIHNSGLTTECFQAKHISPIWKVGMAIDGGTWVTPALITNPFGYGQSTIGSSAYKVYCANFNPGTLSDGQHEIRAFACPKAGNCMQLTSVMAIDGNSSNPTFTARAHGLQSHQLLAVSFPGNSNASYDSAFSPYNWQLWDPGGISVTGGSGAGSGSFTLDFTQPSSIPNIPQGTTVAVQGVTMTGQTCTMTTGSIASNVVTLNYSGCNFPTGSSVNVAGLSSSGADGNNITVTTGGTSSITYPTTAANATLTPATGTITANWNTLYCVTTNNAASGSITCPTLDAAASWSSGGTIYVSANLYCVVGGTGDSPSPGDPSVTATTLLTGDTLQLTANTSPSATCKDTGGDTGCITDTCGVQPSQNETLWVSRHLAGLDERDGNTFSGGGFENPGLTLNNDGSLFIYTNAGGTIQAKNAYVDSWNTSPSNPNCISGPVNAGATPGAIPGGVGYCNNYNSAYGQLLQNADASTQTPYNISSGAYTGCLAFENTKNIVATTWFVGGPVDFTGLDGNTSPVLANYAQYWVIATAQPSPDGHSDGVVLAATPGGPCFTETGTNISDSPALTSDPSFDNLLAECNPSFGCSNSNPESYAYFTPVASRIGHAGWFSLEPDPYQQSGYLQATTSNTTLTNANGFIFNDTYAEGGRARYAMSVLDHEEQLTGAETLGPTPPLLAITGGSLAAFCTGNDGNTYQNCETVTFPSGQPGQFQAATSTGSPGEGVELTGLTPSSWNCGSTSEPCNVINSTPTSLTISNIPASGSYSSGGFVLPVWMPVEIKPGTFAKETDSFTATASSSSPYEIDVTSNPSGYLLSPGVPISDGGVNIPSGTFITGFVSGGGTGKTGEYYINNNLGNMSSESVSYTTPGRCAPSNAPITSANQICVGNGEYNNNSNTSNNFGTTSGMWPINLYGFGSGTEISQNSNCFFLYSGFNQQGGEHTSTNTVLPSPNGTLNDVINFSWGGTKVTTYSGASISGNTLTLASSESLTLGMNVAGYDGTNSVAPYTYIVGGSGTSWTLSGNSQTLNSTTVAVGYGLNAINQCASSFYLQNDFSLNAVGGTDVWWDSTKVNGPSWKEGAGFTAAGDGAAYMTNTYIYNNGTAPVAFSYVWGTGSIYNLGSCVNYTWSAFDTLCTGGNTEIPISLGSGTCQQTAPALCGTTAFWSKIIDSRDVNQNQIVQYTLAPVASVTVTNPGSACSSPTIAFTGGGGSGATATVNVSGGSVSSITVTNGGSDYTSAPTATITGCTGATATAVLEQTGICGSTVSVPVGDLCINSSTNYIGFTSNSLPNNYSPGGYAELVYCGTPPYPMSGGTGGEAAEVANYTQNNATYGEALVQVQASATGGIGGNCDISTNQAWSVHYNTDHIDADFWIGTNYWVTMNNVMRENYQCLSCGNMQQFFTQGGEWLNWDYEDSSAESVQPLNVGAGIWHGLGWAGVSGMDNIIIRNTNMWGVTQNDGSNYQDIYLISVNGGSTSDFGGDNLNPYTGGWAQGTAIAQNPNSGDGINGSGLGPSTWAIWPSYTAGVNGSGFPSVPGPAWSSTLLGCPWYCLATDSGLGSF